MDVNLNSSIKFAGFETYGLRASEFFSLFFLRKQRTNPKKPSIVSTSVLDSKTLTMTSLHIIKTATALHQDNTTKLF